MLSRRYTLVRVVHSFAVFQLTSLLSEEQRVALAEDRSTWTAKDADFGGVAKKASFVGKVFGRIETNTERLWKEGWYCNPLSYRLLDGYFVAREEMPEDNIAPSGSGVGQDATPRSSDANSLAATTSSRQAVAATDALSRRPFDDSAENARPSKMRDQSGSLILSSRQVVSKRAADAAASVKSLLSAQSSSDTGDFIVEFPERPGFSYVLQRASRGRCHASLGLCECFPPFHGLLCEKVDEVAEQSAVVYGTTTPVHNLEELLTLPLKTLRNVSPSLWHTIPLVVFHDAPLSGEHKAAIARRSRPLRVWFSYLSDWVAQVPQHDLSRSEASLGYRHQCRWKSGPLFKEPALQHFEFLFFFDTDSYFPEIEIKDQGSVAGSSDVVSVDYLSAAIEQMREAEHVYAYVHRTREKDSMVAFLWDYTKMYLADHKMAPPREDIDHVSLYNELPDMHFDLLGRAAKLRELIMEAEEKRREMAEEVTAEKEKLLKQLATLRTAQEIPQWEENKDARVTNESATGLASGDGSSSSETVKTSKCKANNGSAPINITIGNSIAAGALEDEIRHLDLRLAQMRHPEILQKSNGPQGGTTSISNETTTTSVGSSKDDFSTAVTATALVREYLGLDLAATLAEGDLEGFFRNNTYLFRWNRHVYMTDLEIMYLPWFRSKRVYDYFHYVDSLHGWYTDRWGDHAFRTLQLKIFLGEAWNGTSAPGVLQLSDFPYGHQRFCTCGESVSLTCDKERRCFREPKPFERRWRSESSLD
ncbi:unnamed protein product [Amoebophrya sp. A25]|nr:unnamed protein product [Amoebophrya sp. A25]|eukprot:GSA25T00012033001.1